MSKTWCDIRAFSWGKFSWTEMICVKIDILQLWLEWGQVGACSLESEWKLNICWCSCLLTCWLVDLFVDLFGSRRRAGCSTRSWCRHSAGSRRASSNGYPRSLRPQRPGYYIVYCIKIVILWGWYRGLPSIFPPWQNPAMVGKCQ